MYNPIIGAGEGYSGHEPQVTPQSTLERVAKLQEQYVELKTDLLEEVNTVDEKLIRPATEGRDYIQPMKKVIKKRQDRKVNIFYPMGLLNTDFSLVRFRAISRQIRHSPQKDEAVGEGKCRPRKARVRPCSGKRSMFRLLSRTRSAIVENAPERTL